MTKQRHVLPCLCLVYLCVKRGIFLHMTKVNWRKINRIVHRDLGYFAVGMCIIYGLSGIALNHIGDWNPNYIMTNEQVQLPGMVPASGDDLSREQAIEILSSQGLEDKYRSHYAPFPNQIKIFVDGGSLTIDTETETAHLEHMRRRPVFYQVNLLHYNPGELWKWFSDFFALSLIILSITGMFILKGKKGIKGRGAILVGAGIILPVILLLLYL